MSAHEAVPQSDAHGRPTKELPLRQLIRMSLYWFGLSSIFAGLTAILSGRLEFVLEIPKGEVGRTLFLLTIGGAVLAMIVQPTVGSISDYTTSRWGRRKPYILIGSLLDVVFLAGIAFSNNLVAIAAFVTLLQFSSNFAQGPFQGYVPDLVPAKQVGLASALVGLLQILGNVGGFAIGALAIATRQYELGLLALGAVELATMLGVFFGVQEGRTPKSREGRSWRSIAAEAWGTDILRERSFLWLVGSRLAILMAGGILVNLATFYLHRSHGLDEQGTGTAYLIMVGLVAIGTVLSVVPSGRLGSAWSRWQPTCRSSTRASRSTASPPASSWPWTGRS
jgi:Na+/melibiose symporter-like transporter